MHVDVINVVTSQFATEHLMLILNLVMCDLVLCQQGPAMNCTL